MVVNLDTELIDVDTGKSLEDGNIVKGLSEAIDKYNANKSLSIEEFVNIVNKAKGDVLTIGLVFRRCLLTTLEKDTTITPDIAQDRFIEAQAMMKGGEYELTEKTRDIIKGNMVKLFPIVVVGQVMNIINPKST